MIKRVQHDDQPAVAADPSQWSEQSQRSVAFHFTNTYVDKPYQCCRCGAACVFTAQDQKYTFEVKKASIDQRRKFCTTCWSESHALKSGLAEKDFRWSAEKPKLRYNSEFLSGWLDLLTRWAEFAPYKQDVAKINMLRGLLKVL